MTATVVKFVEALSTMDAPGRIERMRSALARGVPALRPRPFSDGWLSIVGYGPSLRESWPAITHPMITCSGAYKFLLARGVVANWHAESDPWPAKAMFTDSPHKDTTHLIASCCDPQIWANLEGYRTQLWHCAEPQTQAWVLENDPFGCITGFGTTIGERCLELASILGYHRVKLFGLDCSFTDEQRAGPHQGGRHEEIVAEVGGVEFKTSHAMLYSARTLVNALLREGWECEFYGDGMARAMLIAAVERKAAKDRGVFRRGGNVRAA